MTRLPARVARHGRWRAVARAMLAALVLLVASRPTLARAQSGLRLDAQPVLGAGSPAVDGWVETHLVLENSGARSLSGRLELVADRGMSGESPILLSAAPFAVAARARVSLMLPSHGITILRDAVRARALSSSGEVLAESTLPALRGIDPLLFDLSVPSRLLPALGGHAMPWRKRAYGTARPILTVASPELDPKTGDPIVPDLAAGYASVTLVLASARTLGRLDAPALDALTSWLLAGGALAVTVSRPEDLESPWLDALVGARALPAPVQPGLLGEEVFAVAGDDPSVPKPTPSGNPAFRLQRAAPSQATVAELAGFTGGNLQPSPWGASASYGLGELHLLAFDPDTQPFASDSWVELKMADLVRHAWERANVVALPHGQAGFEDNRISAVRRVLDPNESTRWTVGVSALLLLFYALVAGPLNFRMASRRGAPLSALWYVPVLAGAALGSIVLLGVIGKGVEGRSRHLTLIEAGAAMSRAAATRFRGIYASSAKNLWVRAARGSVLDVMGDRDDTERDLVVDRDGSRLERLRTKPWEVVLVREDGFAGLAGGVSLLPSGSELLIHNRTAHDLVGVVVKAPGRGLTFFPRIRDGESVTLDKGKLIAGFPSMPSLSGLRPLSTSTFRSELEQAAKGLGAAWEALETLTSGDVDWWPDDVPVLLAQLDGGEGKLEDSGLRLDVDRTLLRVVGYGGVP